MVDYFTFASLLLTPMTLLIGYMVISHWGKASYQGMVSADTGARDWLILGIVIGFIGGFADNLYWGIAWHLEYIKHPAAAWWFQHGSVSNVFTRQGAGILSGLCHVVSSYMLAKSHATPKVLAIMAFCLTSGMIYAVILLRGLELPDEPWLALLTINQITIPALYFTFGGQVLWYASKVISLNPQRVATLSRIAVIFMSCGVAGYFMHMMHGMSSATPAMALIHSFISLLMCVVVYRGRDAKRLAGMLGNSHNED